MKTKAKWFETFFDGMYQKVLAGPLHEDRAPDDAKTIRRALKLRKGQTVLDCPCGMGRISLQLARAGLQVTGADLTATYVRRARRRAKAEGLDVPFVRCDMRELPFQGEFDAVVNWFSSFGYFDDAGNLAAARAAFAALKPGGKFLLDVMNKSSLLARFDPSRRVDEIDGVCVIVSQARWDAATDRIHDVWTLSDGKRTERRNLTLRVYNGREMRALLRRAGFRDIRLFGRPGVGRFTRHSRRMLAVAARPVK